MASVSPESRVLVTPPNTGEPFVPHEAEMMIVEDEAAQTINIHDPLFNKPYSMGDRSTFAEPSDTYAFLAHDVMKVHYSVRQLTDVEMYSTIEGTGRWSRGQHMLGVAAMIAHFGGDELAVAKAVTHDRGHGKGSHKLDDLVAGRGSENAHDHSLPSVLRRNGFAQSLINVGLMDAKTEMTEFGVSFEDLVTESDEPSFHSRPSSTGLLENERVQYILTEAGIWIYKPELARSIFEKIVRDQSSPEGDLLVFTDTDAAELYYRAQVRCHTEHWKEPVNEIVDELLTAVDIAVLASKKIDSPFQKFHPSDVFYCTEEQWLEYLESLEDKELTTFKRAIDKIVLPLCELQRDAQRSRDAANDNYSGPVLPDWLRIQESLFRSGQRQQRTVHRRRTNGNVNELVLEMVVGKIRRTNPIVRSKNGQYDRLEDLRPRLRTYRDQQSQWTGFHYDAIIDLTHPNLELTQHEKTVIAQVLRHQDEDRSKILHRPAMPDNLFAESTRIAGAHYQRLGAMPVHLFADRLRLAV